MNTLANVGSQADTAAAAAREYAVAEDAVRADVETVISELQATRLITR